MKPRGRYRRTVVRGRRRYVVCGLRVKPVPGRASAATIGMLLPGATLVLVLVFSAYIIGRPAGYPLVDGNFGHPTIARFTIDDFVSAAR